MANSMYIACDHAEGSIVSTVGLQQMLLVPNLILSCDQFGFDWSVLLAALGRRDVHQDDDQRVQATHC